MIGVERKGLALYQDSHEFQSHPKMLRNQKEADGYLERYRLLLNVKVEWYPPDTDYIEAPEADGVYLRPQILAMGMKFLLTDFVRDLLRNYRNGPLLVGGRGWRVVLSFQALYNRFIADACKVEDFSTLYMIRRTKKESCLFIARSSLEILIVNLTETEACRKVVGN